MPDHSKERALNELGKICVHSECLECRMIGMRIEADTLELQQRNLRAVGEMIEAIREIAERYDDPS